MTLGFTGTSKGMTQKQRATLRYLFIELKLTELHEGDCVGADAQATRLARELKARVVSHPPDNDSKRAFESADEVCALKPYLKRNRDIVAEGVDGLIATPKDARKPSSLRGQGTWTTIGYAQQAKRKVWIIWPDGTFVGPS